VYRLRVSRRTHVVASLDPTGLGEVPGTSRLYLTRACGNPHAELGCSSGRVDAVVPPGTYFLVVDGGDRDAFGRYVLHTALEEPAGIDAACRNAPLLVPGRTTSGRTSGADRLHASCGNRAQSPEQVYTLRLTERRHVVLDVQAEYDSVLSLRSACERESSEVACNDDFRGPRSSRIETDLEPGTYYAIVDGFHQGNAGAFTIRASLSEPSATPAASSPPPSAARPIEHVAPPDVPVAPNPCGGGGPGAPR
jgi:hypothetical protein